LAKPWHFEKAKQLTFTPGLKQVVRFLEDDEQMTMLGDEISSVFVSTYSQNECHPNPVLDFLNNIWGARN
jgi:hypothetical protein